MDERANRMDERELLEQIEDTIPEPTTELDEVDQQLLGLAVLIGLQMLSFIEQADENGLHDFARQIAASIRHNKNLMRLLEMEADDLERVLASVGHEENATQATPTNNKETPPNEPAPAPDDAETKPTTVVNEEPVKRYLYSPAPMRGQRNNNGSLHNYF